MWHQHDGTGIMLASTRPFDGDNGTPVKVDKSTRTEWEIAQVVKSIEAIKPSTHCSAVNMTFVLGPKRISCGFVQKVSGTVDRATLQTPIDVFFKADASVMSDFIIPNGNAIRTVLPPLGDTVYVRGTLLRFCPKTRSASVCVLGRYFETLRDLGQSVLERGRTMGICDLFVRVESDEKRYTEQCLLLTVQAFSSVVNSTRLVLRKDHFPDDIADVWIDQGEDNMSSSDSLVFDHQDGEDVIFIRGKASLKDTPTVFDNNIDPIKVTRASSKSMLSLDRDPNGNIVFVLQ
jgi:hypothetical protein